VQDALAGAAAVGALLGNALDRLHVAPGTDARDDLVRLLVETSDDLLFALDDAGAFTFCNHAPGARGGRRTENLLGRRLVDLVPANDRDELLAQLDRVLEDAERGLLETALLLPDGARVPVRLDLGPLRNSNGAVVGVRGQARDLREVQAARAAAAEAAGEHPRGAEALLGDSPAMQAVRAAIERAQEQRYPVLVVGETGTGKELVARAIHLGAGSPGGRFVPVKCAALPEAVLEVELFGRPAGADGRAVDGGLVAAATGGTLFLDGIDDMPPALQGRLIRVLEAEGAAAPPVRVVAATHRDLARLAERGEFRADLLYRLDVMRIDLPPLRERLPDLPVLARHALHRVRDESGLSVTIDDAALAALARYPWPGNVRELFNTLRRAAVAARDGVIHEADLGAAVRALPASTPAGGVPRPIKEMERDAIVQALAAADGNRKRAATMLGMPRATFYRRLKRLGLL
jgi:PAS domain S-box-containing protein